MKNKQVGTLIIGISLIIGFIIWIFNNAISKLMGTTCSIHGPTCPMYATFSLQMWFSVAIASIILIIGLVLFFSKEEEKTIIKNITNGNGLKAKKISLDKSKLDKDERVIAILVEKSEGGLFQSDIVEKSGFDKVKVTRILDRLEGMQIIERKRRGMSNFVVLRG